MREEFIRYGKRLEKAANAAAETISVAGTKVRAVMPMRVIGGTISFDIDMGRAPTPQDLAAVTSAMITFTAINGGSITSVFGFHDVITVSIYKEFL